MSSEAQKGNTMETHAVRPQQDEARHQDHQTVDTAHALIELYKREFGHGWKEAYFSTVQVHVGGEGQ